MWIPGSCSWLDPHFLGVECKQGISPGDSNTGAQEYANRNLPAWHKDYFERQQAQGSSENRVEVTLLGGTFTREGATCQGVSLSVGRGR